MRPSGGTRTRLLAAGSGATARRLAKELTGRGFDVVVAPVLTLKLLPEAIPWDLAQFDWIVFASVAAVETLESRLTELRGAVGEGRLLLATAGPRTASALTEVGLISTITSERGALGLAEAMEPLPASRILVLQSTRSDSVLGDHLSNAGHQVTCAVVYRTSIDEAAVTAAVEDIRSDRFDVVVLLSPSAAHAILDTLLRGSLGRRPAMVSMGEKTAAAVKRRIGNDAGWITTVAPRPTADGIAEAVASLRLALAANRSE